MKVLETATIIDLPDRRVAVCGDWHGQAGWARLALRGLSRIAPDVSTVIHAGDWSMNLSESDEICAAFGIERVLVVPGNHDYPALSGVLNAHPGVAVRVSRSTWLLPRPFRISVGGRTVLTLSGATSVDRYWRRPNDWSPDETLTDADVTAAISGGPADILITHESPSDTPVRAVRNVLRTNPLGFPRESLVESAESRARVSRVWDAVNPPLAFHGHMHAPGGGTTSDGRRLISLGCNGQEGNLAIVNLGDLTVEVPSLRELRRHDAETGM